MYSSSFGLFFLKSQIFESWVFCVYVTRQFVNVKWQSVLDNQYSLKQNYSHPQKIVRTQQRLHNKKNNNEHKNIYLMKEKYSIIMIKHIKMMQIKHENYSFK